MKKLLLTLLTAVVSFAASAESIVATFTKDNWSGVSNYTATLTSTDGQWQTINFNNNSFNNGWSYIKCGSKNATTTGTIQTAIARPEKINEVVVTVDAVANGSATAALSISSDGTNWTENSSVSSVKAGDLKFTIAAPQTNLYYKVDFVCKNTSTKTNGVVQVSKFTLNYDADAPVDPDKEPAGLDYETTEFTVEAGSSFTAPTLTNPNGLTGITYTSSNTNVATVDAENGTVTLTGVAGSTTIKATFDGNEAYAAGSASYTINVTPAPYHNLKDLVSNGQDKENITAVGNFAVLYQSSDKKYMIVTDGTSNALVYGLTTAYEIGTAISKIEGTVSIYNGLFELTNTKITEGGEGATYTPYEITSATGVNYDKYAFDEVIVKGATITANDLIFANGEIATLYDRFAIGYSNAENVTVTGFVWIYSTSKGGTTHQLCPISVEAAPVDPDKQPAGLSYSAATAEVILDYTTFVAPTLDNPNNLTVTYESSNEDIATINANGNVTLTGATGTTTIKAIFEGNDEFAAQTVSYTLTVKEMEACATPVITPTSIYAGESITITCATEGATIRYTLNGGETVEYTAPIVFDTVGDYTITATATNNGYKPSAKATATITVSEKPLADNDLNKDSFKMSGTSYATYTYNSTITGVTYAAKASVNNGIQINSGKSGNSINTGLIITENPNGLIIDKVVIKTAADASEKLSVLVSNTPGVLTVNATAANASVKFPDEATTISVSSTVAEDNTLTFIPKGHYCYFLIKSNGAVQITSFDVYYREATIPVTPAILINGETIAPDTEYDLERGSVTVTLTAEEGHHIYHKHIPTVVAAADYYFDGEDDGFTKVENHTTDVTINKNGTLTFYAHHPGTNLKSEPVSINFVNDITTSISEIEAAGKVEYFDMQGRRVAAPANGIFIRREGNAATKVRL